MGAWGGRGWWVTGGEGVPQRKVTGRRNRTCGGEAAQRRVSGPPFELWEVTLHFGEMTNTGRHKSGVEDPCADLEPVKPEGLRLPYDVAKGAVGCANPSPILLRVPSAFSQVFPLTF